MRRILPSAVKILISAALLYLAMRKTNFADLAARIDAPSLIWLVAAIIIAFVQIYASAVRWRDVSEYCGVPLTDSQTLRFSVIGSFFNQTLPSSIGGDAMRLWLIGRVGGGWRAATYSIFVDRAIGMIALALIVIVSLPWSYQLIDNAAGRSALVLVDFAAVVGGLGFLILGRLKLPWLKRWWVTHHVHACSVIANRALFSRDRGLQIMGLSLMVHILSAIIACCVVRAINAPASFGQIFLLLPPVILITLIPISIAGWGLRETTMGLAFGYAGLAASEGVNVSLLYGAVYFILGAFGGLVWVFSAEKAAKASEAAKAPGTIA